jgi:hypothetical protein
VLRPGQVRDRRRPPGRRRPARRPPLTRAGEPGRRRPSFGHPWTGVAHVRPASCSCGTKAGS